MDLAAKLRQPEIIAYLKSIDLQTGSKTPFVVEIDPTEICNMCCPGCISEDVLHSGNSFSRDRLLSLAAEMVQAGVKAVILIGGGEPLAHPAVGGFMDYLGRQGIQIGLTTNGTLIDRYLDTISEQVRWTRVSVDAATAETFDALRPPKSGGSLFRRVIDNMTALAKKKKGRLGFSFLMRTSADGFGIRSNIDDIYPAARLARDIGCDYFEIKPSYRFAEGCDHFLVRHEPADMEKARREIERCRELAGPNFKVIMSINLEHALNGLQISQPKAYRRCLTAELRTLVCPSGVYVCPYFRAKDKFRIGQVRTLSFEQMWRGPERRQVLERLDPSVDCQMHCIRHLTNAEVGKMLVGKDFSPGPKLGDYFI